MTRIYLSPPDVGPREREMLIDAFDSGWIAPLGPHVDAFEAELAKASGRAHAAALASGTAALHLALLLSDVGQGDRVYLSTLTFAATANAVCYVGAEPVFIDSDESWTMDPALLQETLERDAREGKLGKAIIPVDLYGQVADYARLQRLADRYEVALIEDAAEALGAERDGKRAGSFGRFAALSFNGNKTITTSGGGALLTDDGALAARARFLATQARDPAPHYEHSVVGYNYRLSNLLAAIGRAQLESLEQKVARRRAHQVAYSQALPGLSFMEEAPRSTCAYWLTTLLLEDHSTRERVRLSLQEADIESRPVWKPMHLQPVFKRCEVAGGAFSEDVFERGLCLPSGSSLSDVDRERIVAHIKKSL